MKSLYDGQWANRAMTENVVRDSLIVQQYGPDGLPLLKYYAVREVPRKKSNQGVD